MLTVRALYTQASDVEGADPAWADAFRRHEPLTTVSTERR
jgi:hypothetical protein